MTKNTDKPPERISVRYLLAVALIFSVTALSWLYLGRVTDERTEQRDRKLRAEVGALWGGAHVQRAPSVELLPLPRRPSPTSAPAKKKKEQPALPAGCSGATESVGPASTDASARLDLDHRRKGLIWYSTYAVRFAARYTFANDDPCARRARIVVPLPARQAVYDDFAVLLDGAELKVRFDHKPGHAAVATARLAPNRTHELRVRYSSRGLDSWSYGFAGSTTRARNFKLAVTTNFDDVDFAAGTLSPTSKTPRSGQPGWQLAWHFNNLLSDSNIAVSLPAKLNPGPLVAEVSRFAPISLLFFFGVLLLVVVLKQVRLHPVHFGMLAGAFFAFHLLFAYMVDHVPTGVAFAVSAATSVGLVVSYLRLVVGNRFALLWAGGAQLLYLVLFSLAFCWEGYTGLTITVFSILTLFVVMQLTAKIDWFSKLGQRTPPPSAGPALQQRPAPLDDALYAAPAESFQQVK